jgi:hypothetical protein
MSGLAAQHRHGRGLIFFKKSFCGYVENGYAGSDYRMNAPTEPGRLALRAPGRPLECGIHRKAKEEMQ